MNLRQDFEREYNERMEMLVEEFGGTIEDMEALFDKEKRFREYEAEELEAQARREFREKQNVDYFSKVNSNGDIVGDYCTISLEKGTRTIENEYDKQLHNLK